MKKYIEALKGISYFEWIRLREGIDSDFEQQIDESRRVSTHRSRKCGKSDLFDVWVSCNI